MLRRCKIFLNGMAGGRRMAAALILLLFLQAGCELAMPYLTADMIDVGIGQGGIDTALPEQISADGMEKLTLLMNAEEREITYCGYHADGQVYRKNEQSREQEEELLSVMTPMMVAVYALSTDGADYKEVLGDNLYVPRELDAFGILKLLPEGTRLELTEAARERIRDVPQSLITQAAINFVRVDMEEQGVDVQAIQRNYLTKKTALLTLAALGVILAAFAEAYLTARLAAGCAASLRETMFQRVFAMEDEQAGRFSAASLTERTSGDTEKVRRFLTVLLREALPMPILGAGAAIATAIMRPQLVWLVLLPFALGILLTVSLCAAASRPAMLAHLMEERGKSRVREMLRGMMVIRAFGREPQEEQRLRAENETRLCASLRASGCLSLLTPALLLITDGTLCLLAWNSIAGINEGLLQSGELVACIQYIVLTAGALLSLAGNAWQLLEGGAAWGRTAEILGDSATRRSVTELSENDISSERAKEFPQTGAALPFGKNAVPVLCFDNVTFQYKDSAAPALCGVSFTVNAGETVAVTGGVGSGKTTLLELALAKWKATGGTVFIEGKDISTYDRKELSRVISYVPQNPGLFGGSLRENLSFRNEDASDAEIMGALEAAQAKTFVSRTEKGLASETAQGGTNFSGGQRQRLAVARALVGDARIYLMDDCYSALDAETAFRLKASLAKRLESAALLITSSRLDMIKDADRILVLDGGAPAGLGTHDELMQSCPVYRRLAASQGIGEEAADES